MAQSDQQLALLKNRLQMPLIVRDLLSAGKSPSDEETFAMHDMLCEFSLEEALLCGAFVMKEITYPGNVNPDDMAFLHMECERLIERYSARDDLFADNPELWADTQIDMLDDMAEDLEGFLDLLALCKLSYEITSPAVAHVLDILDTQLQAQLMMIDEVISMHQQKAMDSAQSQNEQASAIMDMAQIETYGDNIIPFPSRSSARH